MVRRITVLSLVPEHRIACLALYRRLLQHTKLLPAVTKPTSEPSDSAQAPPIKPVSENDDVKTRKSTLADQVRGLVKKSFKRNVKDRKINEIRELLRYGYEVESALSRAVQGDGEAVGRVAQMVREEHRKGQKGVDPSAYRRMTVHVPATTTTKEAPKGPLPYEQPIKSTAWHLQRRKEQEARQAQQDYAITTNSKKKKGGASPKNTKEAHITQEQVPAAPPSSKGAEKQPPSRRKRDRVPSFNHAQGIALLRWPGVPQSLKVSMMIKKKGRRKMQRHEQVKALKAYAMLADEEDLWDKLVDEDMKSDGFATGGSEEDGERPWVWEANAAIGLISQTIVQEAKRNFEKGKKLWAIVEEKRAERDALKVENKRLRRQRQRERRLERKAASKPKRKERV